MDFITALIRVARPRHMLDFIISFQCECLDEKALGKNRPQFYVWKLVIKTSNVASNKKPQLLRRYCGLCIGSRWNQVKFVIIDAFSRWF